MWVVNPPKPDDTRIKKYSHRPVRPKHVTGFVYCLKCRLVKLRNDASEREWSAGCKWN